MTYQPLPRHPFFPAIFTQQMQLELLKVANSVYKFGLMLFPGCYATLPFPYFYFSPGKVPRFCGKFPSSRLGVVADICRRPCPRNSGTLAALKLN
jgi:hypothetical protein